MTNNVLWYSARAAGIVAWALLGASVVWGLVLSTKLRPPKLRPAWMLDLHRFLGGLAAIFTVVHIGSIMLDGYVHFGLADVLVPFASSWHPLWVAFGIVGLYLLLAVELTSLARKYLPYQLWRRVHVLSLPLFAVATIHFALAGTDAGNVLAVLGMLLASAAVGTLVARRLRPTPPPRLAGGRRYVSTATAPSATSRSSATSSIPTSASTSAVC